MIGDFHFICNCFILGFFCILAKYVVGLNMKLRSKSQLSESEIQRLLEQVRNTLFHFLFYLFVLLKFSIKKSNFHCIDFSLICVFFLKFEL